MSDTHYIIGSVVGPHPFPQLVRDLQRVIGDEARAQYAERLGGDPDVVVACVGGGSNAIGMFTAFVGAPGVRLIGVEAGGRGMQLGEHCSSITQGQPGVLHGAMSYLLQDADGQIVETHSISAGLDYPGVGPEHAWLHDEGLAEYVSASDDEALDGFQALARTEGILPALEPSHVIGWLLRRPLPEGARVLVCLSGRGDKDLDTVCRRCGARTPGPDGRPRGGAARASRRRRQGVRPVRDGRLSRASTRRCSARSPMPAPTRSRWACPHSDPVMDGGVIQEASRGVARGGDPPGRRARHDRARPRSTCPSP